MPKLPPQQEMFCVEYLKDLNASEAAIRAGYAKKTARIKGSQLLAKVNIARRIQEGMDKRSETIFLDATKILKRIDKIADVDISKAYDKNGQLLPIHDMPEEVRKSIKSIKVFEEFEGFGKDRMKIGEVREVQFWDKLKANELLGRHLKLFTDKIEHSGKVTLEDLVVGSKNDETDKSE